MSLQHSSGGTSDFPPKFYPTKRPQDGEASRSQRSSSSYGKRAGSFLFSISPVSGDSNVLDATPLADNSEVYATDAENTSPRRQEAYSSDGGNAAPPSQNHFTEATWPSGNNPSPAEGTAPNYNNEGPALNFGIRRLIIGGVALEGRYGLHFHLYINLRVLALALVAIFSGVPNADNFEKARRTISLIIEQLLS